MFNVPKGLAIAIPTTEAGACQGGKQPRSIVEGTYDKATKTMTSSYEGHHPSGNPVKMKMVTVWKGEDHRVWTAFMVGGDEKEIPILTINYKRRK